MGWPMLILGIIGIITGGSLLFGKLYLAGILFLVFAMFLLAGLKRIQEQERWVIELFGGYWKTLKPGLGWILPGAMKVRAKIGIWEQTIPLFDEQVKGDPIKIDFIDGSAIPKGANAFVKVKSPDEAYSVAGEKPRTGVYRATYDIKNWRIAAKGLAENASRSHLNSLTIDEGLTQKGAGFDLKNKFSKEEKEEIENSLSSWGLEITRITVIDFDLEKKLVEARGNIQVQEKEAEAAKYERQKIARETVGALIQMIAEALGEDFETVQKRVKDDSELQGTIIRFAQELITRKMSIDGKVLSDIRVAGGGDIVNGVLAIIAALNQGKRSEKKKRKKEGEEEEEGEEE